jgi:hypothetical protein
MNSEKELELLEENHRLRLALSSRTFQGVITGTATGLLTVNAQRVYPDPGPCERVGIIHIHIDPNNEACELSPDSARQLGEHLIHLSRQMETGAL